MKTIKLFLIPLLLVGANCVYAEPVMTKAIPANISLKAGESNKVKQTADKQKAAEKQKALEKRQAEVAKKQAIEKQRIESQRQAALLKQQAAEKQKALEKRQAEVAKKQAIEKQRAESQRQAALLKKQADNKQKSLDRRQADLAKKQAVEKQKTIMRKTPGAVKTQAPSIKTKTNLSNNQKVFVGVDATALRPDVPTSQSKPAKTVVTKSAQSTNRSSYSKKSASRPTYVKNLKNADKDPVPAVSDTVSLVGMAIDVVSGDVPGAVVGGIVFVTGKSISAGDPNNQTQIDDIVSNLLAAGTTVAGMVIAGSTAITTSSVVAATGFGFSVYSAHTAVQKALGIDGVVGDLYGQAYVALTEDSEVQEEYDKAVQSAAARQAREAADAARRAVEAASRAGSNIPEAVRQAQEAVKAAEAAREAAEDDDVPAATAAANRASEAAQLAEDAAQANTDVEQAPSQNSSGNTNTDTANTNTSNTENTQSSTTSEAANNPAQHNNNASTEQGNQHQNSEAGTLTVSNSQSHSDGSYSYTWVITNSAGEVVNYGTTGCSGGNCVDVSVMFGGEKSYADENNSAPRNGSVGVSIATGGDSGSENNGNSQSDSSQNNSSESSNSQDDDANDTDDDSGDSDSDDDSSGECQAGDANCTNDSEEDNSSEESDTAEEEAPSSDSTPNPNAADEDAAKVVKFYEQTGGRIGGEAVRNQQRALELNRSGGGVTDPVDYDESTSSSEHDDKNIEGKSGGHVDGGREQEPPREVTAQEIEDIKIRAGGGYTDPTDTGNTGGQPPSDPQSPRNPAGGVRPIVGPGGGSTTSNDGADREGNSQLQGVQQTTQSTVQGIKVDSEAIKENLQNRIQQN